MKIQYFVFVFGFTFEDMTRKPFANNALFNLLE